MSIRTLLDQAVSMLRNQDDELAHRMLCERLAHCELLVPLEQEAQGDQVTPCLLSSDIGRFVLAFDDAERLSAYTGGVTESLTIPGKDLCHLIAPEGLGIALNIDVSDFPYLVPKSTVAWIAETLGDGPGLVEDRPTALRQPDDVSPEFLDALKLRFSSMPGAAGHAVLSEATFSDGATGLLLAFINPSERWQPTLSQTVQDAVALLMPGRRVDVGFFSQTDHISAALIRNGISFTMPEAAKLTQVAPGMDPDKPPKL